MSTKTLAESYLYSLAPVNLPEATPGSCRGVFHSNGLAAFDMLLAAAVAKRPNVLDVYTLEMVLRAFFEEVVSELSLNHRVVLESLGITLSLEIGGSFPSMDAAPGEDNPLYVAIRLSDDVWNVLDGVVPDRVDASADKPALYAEEDAATCRQNVVDGDKDFILTGNNLSANGVDEQLLLVDSAKATHVATVVSSGSGQRLTAHFATAPAPGKAKLTLLTHGLKTPEGLLWTLPKWVTVLAGAAPVGPAPELERGYSEGEGHPDGQVFPYYAFILQGVNLDGAAVKIGYTEEGTYREVDVPDEKLTVTDTVITIASDSVELEDAIMSGSATVTFKVTTAGGSATYEAEVQS